MRARLLKRNPYRSLLATPGALGFVTAGFIGRMPMAIRSLGCVLMVSLLTGSYGLAGAVAATLTLSGALAGPHLARLADRRGQRPVLLASLVAHAAGTVALVLAASLRAPLWTLFPAAAVSGAAALSIGPLVRARWTAILSGTQQLQTAFAFESALDEVIYVAGPVFATALAAGVAPAAGLLGALVFAVAGSFALAAQRATEPRPLAPDRREVRRAPVLRAPGFAGLVVSFVFVGMLLGGVEVAMVAFAGERGDASAAGALLALSAVGSLIAGLAYGARRWQSPPGVRFLVAVAGLCLVTAPLALAGSLWTMAACSLVSGVAIAPALIAGNSLVEATVPRAALTEGFTWLSTSIAVGAAAGAAVSGRVADLAGSHAAFAVAVGAGVVAAFVTAAGLRPLC